MLSNKLMEEQIDERIYLNVSIKGDKGRGIPVVYSETRSSPILDYADNYSLGVVRFSVPWGEMPLFIFRVEEGLLQNDPDKGEYIFSLNYGGLVYSENVQFVSDGTDPTPRSPQANGGVQDITNYYYMYNLQRLAFLFNRTLESIFTTFKAANLGAPQTEAPFFIVKDNKLSLVCELSYNDLVNPLFIEFNGRLSKFFEYIPYKRIGLSIAQESRFIIYEHPLYNNGYSAYGVAPSNPPTHLIQEQEFSQVPVWSEVKKITFNTTLIPARLENLSSTNDNGRNVVSPILTDFDVSGWNGNREPIKFSVSSPYRYIDLLSHQPLRSIDISLFWQDSEGAVRPLLAFAQPVDIKLVFVAKNLVS